MELNFGHGEFDPSTRATVAEGMLTVEYSSLAFRSEIRFTKLKTS